MEACTRVLLINQIDAHGQEYSNLSDDDRKHINLRMRELRDTFTERGMEAALALIDGLLAM